MKILQIIFILSVKTSLNDLYQQIENLVKRKIDNKDYLKIQSRSQDVYHSLIVNNEHVIIDNNETPILLKYNLYLQSGREDDFFVDILYSLYVKQTKCFNKILIIKIENSPNPEKISLIFKNISQKVIWKMIRRYNISNYVPDFLIYKNVIVNNLIYDYVIYKMKYGYLNNNTEYTFAFKVDRCRYFFCMSILDLELEPYIKYILSTEYFLLNTKFNAIKKRSNKFRIEVLLQILIDDVYHLSRDIKYPRKISLHVLQHSLLFYKTTRVLFFYQENLNNFFHDLADGTQCNRSFYVYEYGSILGINKCIYSYDSTNKRAFIISYSSYNKIKNYFIYLEKNSYMNSTMIRAYFYIFVSTQFFEYILRDCFKKRFSAEFIVINHYLKFAGLISHNEFINLMAFSTGQVWTMKIYNHMVDIIIKRIINTSINELLSIKCLYFQYFILVRLKYIVNKKDVNDPENKITRSMQKDFIACKGMMDVIPDAYIISVQVKLVIKLILFTFSKNIGGSRMLEFEHFLFEDGRPRLNIFNTDDYTKVKRYLVDSLKKEDNSESLKGYRRYFRRFYSCQV